MNRPLLMAVKYHEQGMYLRRQQARVALETSAPEQPVTGATAGGDERKLRGIPAIGRGVAGAIAGSVPHAIR
jgi:hypothetical protein